MRTLKIVGVMTTVIFFLWFVFCIFTSFTDEGPFVDIFLRELAFATRSLSLLLVPLVFALVGSFAGFMLHEFLGTEIIMKHKENLQKLERQKKKQINKLKEKIKDKEFEIKCEVNHRFANYKRKWEYKHEEKTNALLGLENHLNQWVEEMKKKEEKVNKWRAEVDGAGQSVAELRDELSSLNVNVSRARKALQEGNTKYALKILTKDVRKIRRKRSRRPGNQQKAY